MPQTSVDTGGRLGKTRATRREGLVYAHRRVPIRLVICCTQEPGWGSPQAHTAPLGDKPSHDLKTDDPFDLCHLVLQEQDIARVIERAAEAYRTLRDIYCELGILEALVIFDYSMDMPWQSLRPRPVDAGPHECRC